MELSAQYLAGLFDGEGSVGLYSNGGGGFGVRVQTVQNENPTSLALWLLLQETFGGGMSRTLSTNGRPKMNWSLTGPKAVEFLRFVQPHLILKRAQVDILLDWWDTKPALTRGEHGRILPRSVEATAKAQFVADELRRMKKE